MLSRTGCQSQADAGLGPFVRGCRDDFDFTLAFELYFLSGVPSLVFILIAAAWSLHLSRKKPRVAGNSLRLAKLSAITAYAVFQLLLIFVWAGTSLPFRPAALFAFSLSFVAALALVVLSSLEHSKSIQPSGVINVYMFFSVLLNAVVLRTLWLTPYDKKARDLFTASFVLNTILLGMEATEKRRYFVEVEDQRHSPEESAGLYNQAIYWWLNALIFKGYQQDLTPNDLPPLNTYMTAEALDARFWSSWNGSSRTKNRLLFAVAGALKWEFIAPIFPRLILIAFTICQPLMVRRFLDYLLDPREIDNQNVGYGMIGAYFVIYTGMAISGGFYRTLWLRSLTMIRSTLTAAVFRKTTEISTTATGEKAAVTLMSADVDRIVNGFRDIHELWANFIQIGFATYILAVELGYASIAPVAVAGLSFAAITYLSNFTKIYQGKWLKQTQLRVTTTSSMLGSMKNIRLSGLTHGLQSIIANLRLGEIQSSEDSRLLGAYTSTVASFPLMLSPVLAFAIYSISALQGGSTLDVSRLFTSLSTMVLLSQPLFSLFGSLVNSRAAIGCFDRIESYLLLPSRQDYRVIETPDEEPDTRSDDETIDDESHALLHESNIENSMSDGKTRPDLKHSGSNTEGLSLQKANFGWSKTNQWVVKEVDWNTTISTLSILVGPSASGKSTLLKGILGETPFFEGIVRIPSANVAWCEQTPWLINGTIKKNITNYRDYDDELYKTVLHCCDLEADIAMLSQGDKTSVGSKGVTLSGGQKQRIAIARAVYARPDLAIFDDIFSGLDAVTEKNVFARLFGPEGLLRRWKTTVIIATHAVNLLHSADHIIALGSDGRILEQGSFQSLKEKSNGYVKSLKVDRTETAEQPSGTDGKKEGTDACGGLAKAPKPALGTPSQRKPRPVDLSIYTYYFRSIGWPYALLFLFLQILGAFFSAFPVLWLKWWTEANAKNPENPGRTWSFYIGIYAALQVMGLASSGVLTWFCFSFMARNSGLWLHDQMLNSVMAAPLAFWSQTDVGDITTRYVVAALLDLSVKENAKDSRFSQDIQLVDMNLPLQILTAAQNFFVCIAQAILITSATGWIALSFPPLILVFFALQRYYSRTSKQLRLLELAEKGPLYTQFLESLSGLVTIRAFGWVPMLQEGNFQLVDRAQRPWYLMFMIQRWLMLVLDLVTMCLAVLAVGVAVGLRRSISAGGIGVSLTQIISFTGFVKQFITTQTTLETTLGAISRIKTFTEETKNENMPPATRTPPVDWPRHGAVEISDITATYTPNTPQTALSSVSLSIPPGTKVGICGRTGSGKSSLVLALYRMLDPTSGTITIDGLDIATLPRNTVRARLNGLGQDPYFVSGSVRLNLDPYHASTAPDMIAALTSVGLWETILDKGGLNAEMDADAEMLSQGQKQLFCLARAILRKGKVVVLDEVSSNVDWKTDEFMQDVIRSKFQGRTIISIAHRLENILGCDVVVVMEGGRIVEVGKPDELVKKEGGKFRGMYEERGVKGSLAKSSENG